MISKVFAAAWRRFPIDLQDVLTIGGIAAAAYGAGLVYTPLGWILGGILYASLGLLMALLQARAGGGSER